LEEPTSGEKHARSSLAKEEIIITGVRWEMERKQKNQDVSWN